MKKDLLKLLLAGGMALTLVACDSNKDVDFPPPYILDLEGTSALQVACKITIQSSEGETTTNFNRTVPDRALLEGVQGVEATCTKKSEDDKELILVLSLGDSTVATDTTRLPLGNATVKHP